MQYTQVRLAPGHEGKSRKRAIFLTYQRTTFTDALRTAARLHADGAYEPLFLIAAGRAKLVEREINTCHELGIDCLTEDAFMEAHSPSSHAATKDPVFPDWAGRLVERVRWFTRAGAVNLREWAEISWECLARLVASDVRQ